MQPVPLHMEVTHRQPVRSIYDMHGRSMSPTQSTPWAACLLTWMQPSSAKRMVQGGW